MYKIKIVPGLDKSRGDLTEDQLVSKVEKFMNSKPNKEIVSVQFRSCAFNETWPDVIVTYMEV